MGRRGAHDRLWELTGLIRQALAADDDAAAGAGFEEVLVVLGPHVDEEEGALFSLRRREDALADHVRLLESEHAGLYDGVGAHMDKEGFGLVPAAPATLDGADRDAVDRWAAEHLLSRAAVEGARL
jgi:hypothetical protein